MNWSLELRYVYLCGIVVYNGYKECLCGLSLYFYDKRKDINKMARKIIITSKDRERLIRLVNHEREFGTVKNKDYLKDLEHELDKANIVQSDKIPPSVITMNSRILIKDMDSGEETSYVLVYPEDANLLEDRISILAPIGTAMLGYREGDVIDWKIPDGSVKLRVEKILYQPEAAGKIDL
jgi:regulator of nucleoside diphosphate kinase